MSYGVSSSVRQAVISPAFGIAAASTAAVLFIGSFESLYQELYRLIHTGNLLENGFHDGLFLTGLLSDVMCFALPILAAIPFTAAVVNDMESGFVRLYLPRCGKRQYLLGKISACLISGGLSLGFGMCAYYGMAALLLTPMELAGETTRTAAGGLKATAGINEWLLQRTELMQSALLVTASAALWSMVGMLAAEITRSRYMAYAGPFIIYYVMIIARERYLKNAYLLDPREWIHPSYELWNGSIWGVLLFEAEIVSLLALIFYLLAERRLSEL